MYVYTPTYILHLELHTGIQHAHIQDKYIPTDVSNKLICKHGKTEGAEGEREKKNSSERGKKGKDLITFKLYCQNGGVINGLS